MKNANFMGLAVIDQRDEIVGYRGSVQAELRATFGNGSRLPGRYFGSRLDADMIGGFAISKVKFDVRPVMRQAGFDSPAVGALIDTEQGFNN